MPAPTPATTTSSPVLAQLELTWLQSDRLFTRSIGPHNALTQPISLRHPFIFYLGHLPSFTWSTLSRSYTLPPVHRTFDSLFVRGIDPDVDDPSRCHDHPDVPDSWPSWDAVQSYKAAVRVAVRRAVAAGGVADTVLAMCREHDLMHLETLCYMLAQLRRPVVTVRSCSDADADADTDGAIVGVIKAGEGGGGGVEWVRVAGGRVCLGVPEGGAAGSWLWDNERDAAVAAVDAVLMGKYAVSVAEYARFMRAGGYQTRALWGEDDGDWQWVCKGRRRMPGTWGVDGGGRLVVLVGEEVRGVDEVGEWPVSVSVAEARAYCRWVGGRLMTEAEYLMAAYGERGARYGGSVDVGGGKVVGVREGEEAASGVVGLVGNGWEVTGTVFRQFEGFEAAREYPEYSADFFDGRHYVLKGGSWCTILGVRPSFRNFYQARYPYVFTKFRVVKDT